MKDCHCGHGWIFHQHYINGKIVEGVCQGIVNLEEGGTVRCDCAKHVPPNPNATRWLHEECGNSVSVRSYEGVEYFWCPSCQSVIESGDELQPV